MWSVATNMAEMIFPTYHHEISIMAVRNARRDAIEEFKKLQKNGLPEDAEKDAEDDIQRTHDKFIKKIDELYAAKEKEIMTV